ncbi:MAG TPA: 30S ribosomal protein S7 [Verrucomicrobiales bacterium]|nr:30S ribosomal protein S7 [Verrucomicrobiales bacterium]
MGRKKYTAAVAQLRPDPKFNDVVVSRFINCVMQDGKKSVAQRIVYDAFDIIDAKLAKETDPAAPKAAIDLFQRSIENVKPFVEVRSKRIGGANYQVPMQVNKKRQQSLAFRWILEAVRPEKGRPIASRLADELYNAARGEGKAMATRDQTHKMAEANRAFAHFRF